jgi:hypothetical protein
VAAIKDLQVAIIRYTDRTKSYREMSREEQTIEELCNALYVRLEHRKLCEDECKPESREDKDMSLGDLLHSLGAMSDSGVLERTFSQENQEQLRQVFGRLQRTSRAEKALRQKDAALYLDASADTELFLNEQEKLEKLSDKKTRR